MFGGNTSPKIIKKPKLDRWVCHACAIEIPYWHKKCPTCGEYRDR